jgi:Raf kinase inhibitor-like YbhB/YbcL family protein
VTAAPRGPGSLCCLPGPVAAVVAAGLLAACAPAVVDDVSPEPPWLSSPDFDDGGDIPVEHTCDGADVPPVLVWEGSHPRAVELVLIFEDPDAPSGPFTHWLVAGLEPESGSTASGLPDGAAEGTNDFGRIGWAGPCPPAGDEPHTYRFEVIGLAEPTGLQPGFTAAELAEATAGQQLSSANLTGHYGR